MQASPYIFFNGNCETAFKFYEKHLGGKIEAMLTHEGTPAEAQTPPEWRKKILHAVLRVGDQLLMASDAPPNEYQKPQGFSLSLNVDKPAEAERLFRALSEKGTVRLPIDKTFWAERFGMLVDQFGIPWMVNCAPAVTQEKREASVHARA